MVTLQILVLSFLVRIQVAQQSGRFFDRFFLLSVWVREGRSDLRGAQSVCHDARRCLATYGVGNLGRLGNLGRGVRTLNSISLYSQSEEGFAKQDKAPHPVTKNKRLSRWDNLLDLRKSY